MVEDPNALRLYPPIGGYILPIYLNLKKSRLDGLKANRDIILRAILHLYIYIKRYKLRVVTPTSHFKCPVASRTQRQVQQQVIEFMAPPAMERCRRAAFALRRCLERFKGPTVGKPWVFSMVTRG